MSDNAAATGRSLEEAVAPFKRWLVGQGNEIGELARKNREWKGQVRVIWDAARVEEEPEVLLNLLRYQKVRNKKTWCEPEDTFTPMEAGLQTCTKKAAGDLPLAMELIRHLLVYALRSYTYHHAQACAEGNGDSEGGGQ